MPGRAVAPRPLRRGRIRRREQCHRRLPLRWHRADERLTRCRRKRRKRCSPG